MDSRFHGRDLPGERLISASFQNFDFFPFSIFTTQSLTIKVEFWNSTEGLPPGEALRRVCALAIPHTRMHLGQLKKQYLGARLEDGELQV